MASGDSDSDAAAGCDIPGLPGCPAFRLEAPEPSEIPVLIAVPHAGRTYPPYLTDQMHNPALAALRLEDRLVDSLAQMVAGATGAALLVAHAPRAMIDLNRSPDDVDWEMFDRTLASSQSRKLPGWRARAGLGVIPRRVPGLGELWKRQHGEGELEARLAAIHRPYHELLGATLAQLRDRWGAALLIDLHSMPPLPGNGGARGAEFVLGDRFGAACDGRLIAQAFAHLSESRRTAAHNRPYAGGYVLDRHSAPDQGVHALQIEIDRSCYLDRHLAQPGPGMAAMAELLIGLVRRLAAETVELASQHAAPSLRDAAE